MKEYTPDLNGLYKKYFVMDKNGREVIGDTFVLRPEDPHAQKALIEYAISVKKENPTLAADLMNMVAKHREIESDGFKELLN